MGAGAIREGTRELEARSLGSIGQEPFWVGRELWLHCSSPELQTRAQATAMEPRGCRAIRGRLLESNRAGGRAEQVSLGNLLQEVHQGLFFYAGRSPKEFLGYVAGVLREF